MGRRRPHERACRRGGACGCARAPPSRCLDDAKAGRRISRGARTWKGRWRRIGGDGKGDRVAAASPSPERRPAQRPNHSSVRLASGACDGLRTWPVVRRRPAGSAGTSRPGRIKVSLRHVVVASRRRGARPGTVPDTCVCRPAALSSRAWS